MPWCLTSNDRDCRWRYAYAPKRHLNAANVCKNHYRDKADDDLILRSQRRGQRRRQSAIGFNTHLRSKCEDVAESLIKMQISEMLSRDAWRKQ